MLRPGLYDDLLTERLRLELERLGDGKLVPLFGKLESALLPDYLTRFLASRLHQAFSAYGEKRDGKQVALANRVLESLSAGDEELAYLLQEKIALSDQQELLEELSSGGGGPTLRPVTELSSSSLLTGAPGLPQLGREIELELASADRCDMLVAFVKTGGMRLLRRPLREFTERGGKLRLITTSYLGASDPAVVEELAKMPNVEVRINYDTQAARLHAKAYFFIRESGLSTAYVGSANLSNAAMTSGLEWTVKFAARELPHLFRRCTAEFASYWESPAFELYEHQKPERFREAVRKERGDGFNGGSVLTIFDLSPHPFQLEILAALATARESRQHFRNLIIAATGTGKTMVAAFDYRRFAQQRGGDGFPSLLFIAHRKEILEQAMGSFRQVMKDGNFGELLVDGNVPASMEHVFCSIQSFTSQKLHEKHGMGRWDYVVLDEAHHAEARSYDAIIDLLKPKILLGLTATPERTDGSSVASHFDRPVAAEIRLPDALQDGLLCPFHYFGVTDHTVDLSGVTWARGRYDEGELSKIISGNQLRAELVLTKIREYLPDPYGSGDFDRKRVKGLGFCVKIEHAEFMARCFKEAGIPAEALTSKTSQQDRSKFRKDLAGGRLNFIFVVDVFNEGVDIPEVNCVLFLRPTESHIVYLQQLGRGLRKADADKILTVLDFVGQCRREFRYDLRFSSLLPGKRHRLVDELEKGFPHLPSGCAIVLERQARETILASITQTYQRPDLRIKDAFAEWDRVPTFSEFIERTGEDPVELLRRKSWSEWKAVAGLAEPPEDPDMVSGKLNLALARVAIQRAPRYLAWLRRLVEATPREVDALAREGFAGLAYQLLWNSPAKAVGVTSLADALRKLHDNPWFIEDLREVLEWAAMMAGPVRPAVADLPETLEVHGFYSGSEINAIFGKTTIEGGGSRGTGLVPVHEQKVLIHLVTFEKTEKQFSESTMYRDFPTSPDLLHWESQSVATQEGKIGKIYANHQALGYRILFFARIRKMAAQTVTSPFMFLGTGQFIDAKGNRPIEIRWKLDTPMPMSHYREARLVCGLEG
jgi:superfamily II DNA or RNA helicase